MDEANQELKSYFKVRLARAAVTLPYGTELEVRGETERSGRHPTPSEALLPLADLVSRKLCWIGQCDRLGFRDQKVCKKTNRDPFYF